MTATNGGRWIFSTTGQPIVLGFNNGSAPIFPPPQSDAFNIEVFTNTMVLGVPNADPGFQSSINDPGGVLEMGFLTGTDIRLGGADLLVVDSVTGFAGQGPSKFTVISGNHTVIGARGDTLVGGSGNQILSALSGGETVIGGTGDTSIWGGANDSIALGTGNQQVVVTGPGTTVEGGGSFGAVPIGSATITTAAQAVVGAAGGSLQPLVIATGPNSSIDLFGGFGSYAVIGAFGDTIRGDGTTNIDGTAGGMRITVSEPGFSNGRAFITGSAGPVAGDTIYGGSGPLVYNPGPVAGNGDLIDLTAFSGYPIGPSTINAFSFGSTRVASPDTILGGWDVFGGDGDRIGTGTNALFPVTAAQWVHADTVAGSAIGFGSNSTTMSATYDTVAGTVTRAFRPGNVSVGGFNTGTDFIFYQNETAQTTSAIIATSQATTVNGIQSTIIVLPDSTAMTLIGVTQAQLTPVLFKP
jgi:hypothetical protein